MLAVHNGRHSYRAEHPLTSWVHAIAKYKLMDFLRLRARGDGLLRAAGALPPVPGARAARVAAAPRAGHPYPTAALYTATIDPPGASAPVYPTAQAQPQIQYADGSRDTPPQGAGAMPKV